MDSVDDDQSWVTRALRAFYEPDALFVQGATRRRIRVRCLQYKVCLECPADALWSEANFGIWDGLTERERRAILRHYEGAENWCGRSRESDDPLATEIRSPRMPRVLAHVRARSSYEALDPRALLLLRGLPGLVSAGYVVYFDRMGSW